MKATEVLARLKETGTQTTLDGMARYGIVAKHAYGVPMGALLKFSKELGKDHALSLALWDTGCYEARLLASLIGDPERVTRAQMNAWARTFENWGDGDTVCFKLFDQTPLAWEMVEPWAESPREFTKRGGFALLACLALHDKKAPDERFLAFVPLIEEGARDARNFVMKGVNWALRSIGRRNPALRDAALVVATRLASMDARAPRWVGKDAVRELTRLKQGAKVAVPTLRARSRTISAKKKRSARR
jgi:3-methyladenine DNA glycosylase AlkD